MGIGMHTKSPGNRQDTVASFVPFREVMRTTENRCDYNNGAQDPQ